MTDILLKPICWNCNRRSPYDLERGICMACSLMLKTQKAKPTGWYTELL